MPIENKTVVVGGSGPLLLAVANYLQTKGAKIRVIAEQADRPQVARFALGLVASPGKLRDALRMRIALRGVPYRLGCWPVAANGVRQLENLVLTDGMKRWNEPCDFLACGFHLVPSTELPRLLGCAVREGKVVVDEWQQTSAEGVLCAGEATGIGGLEKSIVEGQIAGNVAAGRTSEARRLFGSRARAMKFAKALARAFSLRDELRSLPQPETVVCRCEDVTWSSVAAYDTFRTAKLQTRCGMGPCQARICGSALEFLRGWPRDSIRPPLFPARLQSLASAALSDSSDDPISGT
jgi:NADPH-dependent 2,4-dienoyl-CoA reductase/sulfur reductase-like enzyme